jgi:hypothetical protein
VKSFYEICVFIIKAKVLRQQYNAQRWHDCVSFGSPLWVLKIDWWVHNHAPFTCDDESRW